MQLLANSSYGYQIMDRSRHTVTRYLNDEKTHSAISSKKFRRPNHIANQLNKIELVKPKIEQKKPNHFFDFSFHNVLNRKYCNFIAISLKGFCDADKFEELGMDTNFLHFGLSKDVILTKNVAIGMPFAWEIADTFTANATDKFFPRKYGSTQDAGKEGTRSL